MKSFTSEMEKMKKAKKTVHYGIVFHPRFPPKTLPDFACRAEAGGFDELWLWDDCFLPGALTSAAIALSATEHIKVGIGLIPVVAYNPMFAAMEITTLACAFPGRIIPGFGYGVSSWMAQIGGATKPSLTAFQETVDAVRRLLEGEMVTMHGKHVHMEGVQMQVTPAQLPPLYIGAMREKTFRLSGREGDGTILTAMSSPAYVQWAKQHIRAGMDESGRTRHRITAYLDVKVNPDGEAARAAARRILAKRLPWNEIHLLVQGIQAEVAAFIEKYSTEDAAQHIRDEWLDAFCAAGTPEQVTEALPRWFAAGVDSLVFQPLDGDPDCLEEYIRYLMPSLKLQ